jgi:hypothetical protein
MTQTARRRMTLGALIALGSLVAVLIYGARATIGLDRAGGASGYVQPDLREGSILGNRDGTPGQRVTD